MISRQSGGLITSATKIGSKILGLARRKELYAALLDVGMI
tara:strand:- start:311 stop:430 length:120 start_codon:yes stop_codon:yes gene_type:complete